MNKAFDLIEDKIKESDRKRQEYNEVDNYRMYKFWDELYHEYVTILDLMIDGKMYRDLKDKKRKEMQANER